ncbi:hypothetical protein CKO_02079 [Citrobacter koseri ATCC BAA-895]|uniref:Uncharacterized protein n=1 Tax=Citrobacter koseri (strain ATCC BAA-895 / CDC 4225-83 / SGSC4696) TaxID=290338 RepID=A8AI91_CITK8|nr:hypothetical protein CKO_02079 [Citrobacter koseri ATCC BAA-895]
MPAHQKTYLVICLNGSAGWSVNECWRINNAIVFCFIFFPHIHS